MWLTHIGLSAILEANKRSLTSCSYFARVGESVDPADLKSAATPMACRFDSGLEHHCTHRLSVRTPDFHSGKRGSTPRGCTILKHTTGRVVGGGSPTKDASPTKKFDSVFQYGIKQEVTVSQRGEVAD